MIRSLPRLLAGCLFLFLLLPASAADPDQRKPLTQGELEKLLRKLEKDIAEVRGLAFKAPVKAKIIARPGDAARGVQGYYSLKDKTLFLYDDIKGNYQMGVLVHEMVHALQDQHFSLKKLHETSRASGDSDRAMAALIEGDATFTMIELLKKDQPRVTAMLDAPLEKSQNLHNAFLYAQGARYVMALKEKGGWKAVDRVYLFAPGSTAAILSPRESVSTIDLGPGRTLGALELIEALRENKATHADAVPALLGWRGDREVKDAAGKAILIAFASPEQARRYRETLTRFVQAQVPGLKAIREGPDEMVGQTENKGVRAVLQRGNRVLSIEARDLAGYQRLRDRLEGPPVLEVHSARLGKTISFGEMIDR